MLTATEEVRVQNFTRDFDPQTGDAMRQLFIMTKPGKNAPASALIEAAHHHDSRLQSDAVEYFKARGLVYADGTIPCTVKRAIRKAVTHGFLTMKGMGSPSLKPDPQLYPSYE